MLACHHGSRIEMYGIYKDRFGFYVRVCEGARLLLSSRLPFGLWAFGRRHVGKQGHIHVSVGMISS